MVDDLLSEDVKDPGDTTGRSEAKPMMIDEHEKYKF